MNGHPSTADTSLNESLKDTASETMPENFLIIPGDAYGTFLKSQVTDNLS